MHHDHIHILAYLQGLFELLDRDGKLLIRDEAFAPCVYSTVYVEIFFIKALYLGGVIVSLRSLKAKSEYMYMYMWLAKKSINK